MRQKQVFPFSSIVSLSIPTLCTTQNRLNPSRPTLLMIVPIADPPESRLLFVPDTNNPGRASSTCSHVRQTLSKQLAGRLAISKSPQGPQDLPRLGTLFRTEINDKMLWKQQSLRNLGNPANMQIQNANCASIRRHLGMRMTNPCDGSLFFKACGLLHVPLTKKSGKKWLGPRTRTQDRMGRTTKGQKTWETWSLQHVVKFKNRSTPLALQSTKSWIWIEHVAWKRELHQGSQVT